MTRHISLYKLLRLQELSELLDSERKRHVMMGNGGRLMDRPKAKSQVEKMHCSW